MKGKGKSRFSTSGHILTEKPDDLTNPQNLKFVEPPIELVEQIMVNMHAEDRQERIVSWVMDDLRKEIEKLQCLFGEKIQLEFGKTVIQKRTKFDNMVSYEILKVLSSVSDWLSEANIDGELYTLSITDEEMESAENGPVQRRKYVEEQAAILQGIIDKTFDKTGRVRSFVSSRQGLFEEFLNFLGGKKQRPQPPGTEGSKYGIIEILSKLKGLETFGDIEKKMLEWEELMYTQSETIEGLQINRQRLESNHVQQASKLAVIEKYRKEFNIVLADIEDIILNLDIKDELKKIFLDNLSIVVNRYKDMFNNLVLQKTTIEAKKSIAVEQIDYSKKKRKNIVEKEKKLPKI